MTRSTTKARQAPLSVAVLGAGRIGRKHAETLARRIDGVRVAWVVEPIEATGRAVAEEFGARWTPEPGEAVTDSAVDAVIIATPTNTHAEFIELAAGAGKAIFCEKPIDLTMERTLVAVAAAERAGVPLQIGFQRRYDPSYERARSLIEGGAVGRVELVTATSRDPQPAPLSYLASSGGIFRDSSIHDFDIVRYLTGEEVREVFAYGAALVDPAIGDLGDADTVVASLRFVGGGLGVVTCSRRSVYGYDVVTEVFGSNGKVVVGDASETAVRHYGQAGVSRDYTFWFLQRFEAAYVAEVADFIACLREDRAPRVTGEDGRAALAIADAATRSFHEGRPVAVEPRPTTAAADPRSTTAAADPRPVAIGARAD